MVGDIKVRIKCAALAPPCLGHAKSQTIVVQEHQVYLMVISLTIHRRRKGLKVGGAWVPVVAAKVDLRCGGLGAHPQTLTKVSFLTTLK